MIIINRKDVASENGFRKLLDNAVEAGSDTAFAKDKKSEYGRERMKWILMEYMKDTILYRDRKMDVRMWAVITSLDPLRILTLSKGQVKVASVAYSTLDESADERCIHWNLPYCKNGASTNFSNVKPRMMSPYPKHTATPTFITNFRYTNGEKLPKSLDWFEDLWPKFEDRLVQPLLLAREYPEVSMPDAILGDRTNRFLFLTPDFAIERKNMEPVLEEINTNGFMIGDRYKTYLSFQKETEEVIHALGGSGYLKRSWYAKELEAILNDFCQFFHHCFKSEVRMLTKLVDEVMHMEGSWYLMFPYVRDEGRAKAIYERFEMEPSTKDAVQLKFIKYLQEYKDGLNTRLQEAVPSSSIVDTLFKEPPTYLK